MLRTAADYLNCFCSRGKSDLPEALLALLLWVFEKGSAAGLLRRSRQFSGDPKTVGRSPSESLMAELTLPAPRTFLWKAILLLKEAIYISFTITCCCP